MAVCIFTILSAFAASALLRSMEPGMPPYWELFRQTWKIVMVVSMGTGVVGYAVQELQRKLQEKNKLLELAVERGNVVLQQQEQELHRALEIQINSQGSAATPRRRARRRLAARSHRRRRLFRRHMSSAKTFSAFASATLRERV
jgi:hypothetical protein